MRTSVAKGISYLMVSSLIFMVTGYIINIWLGRFLGPPDYGIYGLILSLISFTNIVQTSGLTQSVSKYVAEYPDRSEEILKSGFNLQILYTLIISVVVLILSDPLGRILNDPSLIPYIRISLIIIFAYGFYGLYVDYYAGLHNFGRLASMNILYSILKLIFVITFSYYYRLYGVMYGLALSLMVALGIGFRFSKSKKTFPYKKLIYLSIPLLGFALFLTLMQSIDLFFIKALIESKSEAGYYTAAQNIARVPFFALIAISSVIFPAISRSTSEKLESRTKAIISKSLRIVLLILVPGVTLISITSSEIVNLLYSEKYIAAAAPLSTLSIGFGFLTVFMVLANVLNGAGHPTKSLIISIISVVTISSLCSILIPLIGLNGGALATTIGGFITMILAAIVVYNKFQTLVSVKSVAKILFASGIIYFLAKIIILPTILLPLTYIILFSIYFVILILLKEITKKDFEEIKKLIPERFRFLNLYGE